MIMKNHSLMASTTPLVLAFTVAVLFTVTVAQDELKTNQVEFKTEPPLHSPFPEKPKDCFEYLYGKLSAIRKHGTVWQNGGNDCSNCTCINGDIRCFFHFCNEPPTGYMTPPSVEGDLPSLPVPSKPETVLPKEDLPVMEEEDTSSGFPPDDLTYDDTEEESRVEWPPKVLPEKWQKELSAFETSSAPSDASLPQADDGFSSFKDDLERKDPAENETHEVARSFCEKTCKKFCPNGFKVDPVTGCLKCKCDPCPPSTLPCARLCPEGYDRDVDAQGCVQCLCQGAYNGKDSDIIFADEKEGVVSTPARKEEEEIYLAPPITGSLPGTGSGGIDADASGNANANANEEKRREGKEEKEWLNKMEEGEEWWTESESSSPSEEIEVGKTDSSKALGKATTSKKALLVTSFSSTPDENSLHGNHDREDEPCDTTTTQLRGCLDGTQKFSVGETWSRGPCVACKCVAPGYSECNITQCHALHSCPLSGRFTPAGACCAVCKDDPPPLGFLERASKPPMGVSSQSGASEESFPLEEESRNSEDVPVAVPSRPQDTSLFHLLLILIPMGILFSVGALFLARMWRRYHRDKYDINAYRPEEKQKLRPVKTLSDDSSSVGHVC